MKKIFVDTDVFVIYLRYSRDLRGQTNSDFLEKIKKKKLKAVTSIFNVLETCGILSFNLNSEELLGLYRDFTRIFNIKILWPANSTGELSYDLERIFSQIQSKQSLGDAQVSYVIDRFQAQLSAFISWNAAHFADKIPLPAWTPKEFLGNSLLHLHRR